MRSYKSPVMVTIRRHEHTPTLVNLAVHRPLDE